MYGEHDYPHVNCRQCHDEQELRSERRRRDEEFLFSKIRADSSPRTSSESLESSTLSPPISGLAVVATLVFVAIVLFALVYDRTPGTSVTEAISPLRPFALAALFPLVLIAAIIAVLAGINFLIRAFFECKMFRRIVIVLMVAFALFRLLGPTINELASRMGMSSG